MKAQQKFLVALLAIFSLATTTFAQVEGQEEMIKRRAAEKVGQMNDYISFMANKKKPEESRLYYRTKALNLFIGKGSRYEENGVTKEGVMMQVTSKNRKSVSTPFIRDYFQNLVTGLRSYTDVKIEATEIADIKVSELRQIDTNLWVCTCQYDQAFEGVRDGRLIYRDITTKRIKCYVVAEDTEDGWEFIILLGDVYAIETR